MRTDLKKMCVLVLFAAISPLASGQETAAEGEMQITKYNDDSELKLYVIERNVEGIGSSSVADLQDVTKRSCQVLHDMGSTDIQWVQSYFTGNKIYCIYRAKNKELIKEHAITLGVPADEINEIRSFVTSEQ